MEKVRTAAVIAAMTVLACGAVSGCSVSTPAPADSGRPTMSPSAPAPKAESSSPAAGGTVSQDAGSQGAVAAAGTKEACELFNKLVADYGAVPPADSNGYEEVYRKAQDAKDTVSGDLRGLFTSLGLLALDRSTGAEAGGKPAQASQDAVRDAVFANAGACTAAGVTLRL
ncbi:hypothetical protein [Pseudarthrobacter phenanthrenivorans]|uniref:hypothetical protein n=1 Tax=Pseudarthrobacter phenanthrenivorans TaxID=361575 RepID=UPI002F35D838